MRTLFHDYSSDTTTEPRYLTAALKNCGLDAHLWGDLKTSAFDVFDQVKPDVFVTHWQAITPDIVKYLSQAPQIKLVMNVTGMSDSQVSDFESFTKEKGITVAFIFTNSCISSIPKCEVPYHRIFPAFDLFSIVRKDNEPLCPRAIFAKGKSDLVDAQTAEGGVYHRVQFTNGEIDPGFDIRSNAASAHHLYKSYKSFTLVGETEFCCSQIFFDLTMNATGITVKPENVDQFGEFLKTMFKDGGSFENIGTELKNQLKSKHTPFHRAGTFVKHLKDKDAMTKVEQMKGHFPDALKDV